MKGVEYSNTSHEGIIDLSRSPHDTYSILDVPHRRAEVAPQITDILKQRGYLVHLLTGDDRPSGVAYPFGVWPHPDAEALAVISEVTEMPVRTPEERAELEKEFNVSVAA